MCELRRVINGDDDDDDEMTGKIPKGKSRRMDENNRSEGCAQTAYLMRVELRGSLGSRVMAIS